MNRLLLGYDLLAAPTLIVWDDGSTGWKETTLLRPEVQWPISVDRLICPSIFQPEYPPKEFSVNESTKLVLTRFPSSGVATRAITHRRADWPESEINILGLWCDLGNMLKWLEEKPELREVVRLAVAIQVILQDSPDQDPIWDMVSASGTRPALALEAWARLGYDVANGDKNSALSGLGYTEDEEISSARLRWGKHVNDWGLLDDLESAAAFKEFSDKRVAEHAPFYLYEILRIDLG